MTIMGENYVEKDGALVVPFSDDDPTEAKKAAELIEEDEAPDASLEERKSRREKRKERLQTLLADGKQSKEEAAQLRKELAELKASQARLEGFVAAQQGQQRQSTGDADPYRQRLDAIEEKRKNAYRSAQAEIQAGKLDEKRNAYYESLAREIDEERAEVLAERAIARREPMRNQQAAQQQWVNKYPEIYRDDRAFQWARAKFQMRLADGEASTNQLVDEVMEEARVRYKLGGKSAPTVTEKDRYSGMGAASTRSSGSSADNNIRMTKEMRSMATALYPTLSEGDAIKKWTDKVGKKLREKRVL